MALIPLSSGALVALTKYIVGIVVLFINISIEYKLDVNCCRPKVKISGFVQIFQTKSGAFLTSGSL